MRARCWFGFVCLASRSGRRPPIFFQLACVFSCACHGFASRKPSAIPSDDADPEANDFQVIDIGRPIGHAAQFFTEMLDLAD
jgi:hypothetical protein